MGHAALGAAAAKDENVTSAQSYAARHGYRLLDLQADDMDGLRQSYCPELALEMALVETSLALKYCAVWHALQRDDCDYMAWIGSDDAVLDDTLRLDQFVKEGIDAVWFQQRRADAQSGSCGDHFEDLGGSIFAVGDDAKVGWLKAFIHLKLAFSSMPKSFLETSDCKCDPSQDACTTACLYRHHPEWLDKAKCPQVML